MMGMFNLFILLPQMPASGFAGMDPDYLHSETMNALVLGGASMGLAALLTIQVIRQQRFSPVSFRNGPMINEPSVAAELKFRQNGVNRVVGPVGDIHRLKIFCIWHFNRPGHAAAGEVD